MKKFLRQIRLVGIDAQKKIEAARASAASDVEKKYLIAAGVGHVEMRSSNDVDSRFDDLDPAARDFARGAHAAVVTLKKIIAS